MADTVTMKESEKKSSLICKAAVFYVLKEVFMNRKFYLLCVGKRREKRHIDKMGL